MSTMKATVFIPCLLIAGALSYYSPTQPVTRVDHFDRVAASDEKIRTIVHTCYGGLLDADITALSPGFIVGDFDGNGKDDLLVPVRLAAHIDKRDRSILPFNFQEVLDSRSPATVALKLTKGSLGVVENWPLLAVVHNLETAGGSSCPTMHSSFLLLFAMNKATRELSLFSGKRLPKGTVGDPKEDQPPPTLKGEAILLLDSAGDGAAIYWDGSRYRWYPVNDFRSL